MLIFPAITSNNSNSIPGLKRKKKIDKRFICKGFEIDFNSITFLPNRAPLNSISSFLVLFYFSHPDSSVSKRWILAFCLVDLAFAPLRIQANSFLNRLSFLLRSADSFSSRIAFASK